MKIRLHTSDLYYAFIQCIFFISTLIFHSSLFDHIIRLHMVRQEKSPSSGQMQQSGSCGGCFYPGFDNNIHRSERYTETCLFLPSRKSSPDGFIPGVRFRVWAATVSSENHWSSTKKERVSFHVIGYGYGIIKITLAPVVTDCSYRECLLEPNYTFKQC